MTPNELAKTQNICSKTVNRYEMAGLFDGMVMKLENGHRKFCPEAKERLAQIIHMKNAWGMKLHEIKYVFMHDSGYMDGDEFHNFMTAIRCRHEKIRAQAEGYVKNMDRDYFDKANIGGSEEMNDTSIETNNEISEEKAVMIVFNDIFVETLEKACDNILRQRLDENNGKLSVEDAGSLFDDAAIQAESVFLGMTYDGIPIEYFDEKKSVFTLRDDFVIIYTLENENIVVNLYDISGLVFAEGKGEFDVDNDDDIEKVSKTYPCFSCYMKKDIGFEPLSSSDMYDELKRALEDIGKPIIVGDYEDE